jgi:hypothetical protein
MSNQNERPSEDWAEVHYELTKMIEEDLAFKVGETDASKNTAAFKIQMASGSGGLWKLAYMLTCEFMAKYNDELWGVTLDWFETLEEYYQLRTRPNGEEGEKFCRKCSFTEQGMNQGWVFEDGTYASTQELADAHAVELGYKNFEDLYNHQEDSGHGGESYWTEWQEDYQFIIIDGILTEIEDEA